MIDMPCWIRPVGWGARKLPYEHIWYALPPPPLTHSLCVTVDLRVYFVLHALGAKVANYVSA